MQVLRGGLSFKPVRVLIADDDALLRDLIRTNIEARVDVVREAEDGQRAWEILQTETFELALLDLSMPGIDGYALIRCIRSHPKTRHLPIVVVTSSTDHEAVRRALDAGATSFLTKPINWQLFGHHVDYLIRVEQQASAQRATKQRAEAVARAKDALFAVLAARVRGQTSRLIERAEAELWRRPGLHVDNLDFAAEVAADARTVEEILDEVLPFVRSMTEQIVVDDRLVPVARVVEACAARLRPMAVKANVELEVSPIAGALRIRCDQTAIDRALGNLVRNAIEFTAPGTRVTLGVDLREDHVLSIRVDDEGPGVDPEIIARCLKPLDMRDGSEPNTPQQSALGLPVAHAIAHAHGGTVEVTSRSPRGTRASLIMPAEAVETDLDEVA